MYLRFDRVSLKRILTYTRSRAQFIELTSWCQKWKEENPQQEKTDTKTYVFIQRITSSVAELIEDSTL